MKITVCAVAEDDSPFGSVVAVYAAAAAMLSDEPFHSRA